MRKVPAGYVKQTPDGNLWALCPVCDGSGFMMSYEGPVDCSEGCYRGHVRVWYSDVDFSKPPGGCAHCVGSGITENYDGTVEPCSGCSGHIEKVDEL